MFLCTKENYRPFLAQFFATFSATLGILSNGIDYGWSSPAIPLLLNESRTPIDLTQAVDGPFWIQTTYILGGICALPLTCYLSNKIGRKKSILLGGTIGVTCWILTATARNYIQLYVSRFLSGAGANLHFVCIPMYIAEVADPQFRGTLGTLIQLMSHLGILLAYCIVPVLPIWGSCLISLCIPLMEILLFSFQPESPYYELIKGNQNQARKTLLKLRKKPPEIVGQELIDLTVAVERQEKESGRMVDLIKDPGNRKATFIMVLLNSGQHLSGSSVMIMNMQTIISKSGEDSVQFLSPEMASIMFGVAMIVSILFGTMLIDRLGRRILLVSSYILSSVFLGILAIYLWLQPQGYTWVPIFATIAFALVFKYGLGLVPVVVTSELFPTSLKSKGMVISDLWFTLMATVSLRMYYGLTDLSGEYFPFLIFAIFAFVIGIVIQFYLPETKGLTLEEIQFILKGKEKYVSIVKPILGENTGMKYT